MKKFWYNKINKWITKRTTIRFAVESLFPLKLEPDSSCAKGRRKEWVVIMKKDMRYYVEISGQRMEENLTRRRELLGELADLYRKSQRKDICIIASGSSLNAAMAAESFMRSYCGGRVLLMSPTEYMDYRREEAKKYFCIAISQSGCSTNTIEAVKCMKEDKIPAVVLTGNVDAGMKEYADCLIEYGVGNEAIDYVTLGFSTLVEYLMLLALEAGKQNGALNHEECQKLLAKIKIGCQANSQMYQKAEEFTRKHYQEFLEMSQAVIVSDGAGMGIAREAALKFQETLKIPALYYESEEYIHGPNRQLTPDYAVFFIDTNEKHGRMQEIFAATGLVTEKIYMVTNKKVEENERVCAVENQVGNEVTPLFTGVLFQYIAAVVTEEKNGFLCHPLFEKFEECR